MRRSSFARLLIALSAPSAFGCLDTTGGEIVDFPVAAAGAADLRSGEPVSFMSDRGWHVVLTQATLHVGGVYLDQSAPVSGAQATSCILPGTYVAQMTHGMDVDLLSPAPQRFPALGHGTTDRALVGQLWLTGGDVNEVEDRTPILVVAGVADKGGDTRPFTGRITIGASWLRSAESSFPGANPICKQRIVPVLAEVQVASTGGLLVRVDARKLFTNVDWGALAKPSSTYAFTDAPDRDQPSTNLYANLHAGSGAGSPYSFEWSDAL
jgi:hypothetical protein